MPNQSADSVLNSTARAARRLFAWVFLPLLAARTVLLGDLGETKLAVQEHYGDASKKQQFRTAELPGVEMIEFNLGYVSDSGKYARVWLKNDRSVMESHIAKSGLAEDEINALIDRNVGKSEWKRVPVGKEVVTERNEIWLRNDHAAAAFLVRMPRPERTGLVWLTTSFTFGQLEVLKSEISQSELVGDAAVLRQLWSTLERFLQSGFKAPTGAP